MNAVEDLDDVQGLRQRVLDREVLGLRIAGNKNELEKARVAFQEAERAVRVEERDVLQAELRDAERQFDVRTDWIVGELRRAARDVSTVAERLRRVERDLGDDLRGHHSLAALETAGDQDVFEVLARRASLRRIDDGIRVDREAAAAERERAQRAAVEPTLVPEREPVPLIDGTSNDADTA